MVCRNPKSAASRMAYMSAFFIYPANSEYIIQRIQHYNRQHILLTTSQMTIYEEAATSLKLVSNSFSIHTYQGSPLTRQPQDPHHHREAVARPWTMVGTMALSGKPPSSAQQSPKATGSERLRLLRSSCWKRGSSGRWVVSIPAISQQKPLK